MSLHLISHICTLLFYKNIGFSNVFNLIIKSDFLLKIRTLLSNPKHFNGCVHCNNQKYATMWLTQQLLSYLAKLVR